MPGGLHATSGRTIAERAMKHVRHLRYVPIDNDTEEVCAATLKRSGFFLATAVGEWFGLPALEAMAAGCVVVSVPVVAMEHLRDGDTACVVEPARLPMVLDDISGEGAGLRRAALRDHGAAMASRYRTALHRRKLENAMKAGFERRLVMELSGMELSVVIPSYGLTALLRTCVLHVQSGLARALPGRTAIVVVDNGSAMPYQADDLATPDVRILRLDRRHSFSGGVQSRRQCRAGGALPVPQQRRLPASKRSG